jgi:prepilin-type N-terminal cleavage/methylation domain-containing protein
MKYSTDGFTLVELLIAVILLSIGALALSSSSGSVTRMLYSGRNKTNASAVAQSRLEQLRNTARSTIPNCTALASGSATTGVFSESWTVTGTGRSRTVTLQLSYRSGPRLQGDTLYTQIYCP